LHRSLPEIGEFLSELRDIHRSPAIEIAPRVSGMDAGRPATLLAWIDCESCGRIDKPAHEFNYPEDLAEDAQLFVWLPCERCGRQAKLHLRREVKLAH
jgi:hypothetical protein